jgi:Metallo-beta-lactamase superfamily
MGFEVDFLPVGEGEKSGDAIAIRCGNLNGSRSEQFVMVIDGGTLEAGERLVEHIAAYYHTDTLDLVVNTHPDGDHSSGLYVVLQKLKVRRLWMHRPWEHSGEIADMFKDGTLTNDRLSTKMQKALSDAWDLERLAKRKGIPITEPFSDGEANRQYNGITVLGPSVSYYESLLPDFRDMPDVKEQVAAYFSRGVRALYEAAAEVVTKVAESWGKETLKDPEVRATSAENNSSAILLLRIDGQTLLFTGDAGVPALERHKPCRRLGHKAQGDPLPAGAAPWQQEECRPDHLESDRGSEAPDRQRLADQDRVHLGGEGRDAEAPGQEGDKRLHPARSQGAGNPRCVLGLPPRCSSTVGLWSGDSLHPVPRGRGGVAR